MCPRPLRGSMEERLGSPSASAWMLACQAKFGHDLSDDQDTMELSVPTPAGDDFVRMGPRELVVAVRARLQVSKGVRLHVHDGCGPVDVFHVVPFEVAGASVQIPDDDAIGPGTHRRVPVVPE